jgi:hypothetical protein
MLMFQQLCGTHPTPELEALRTGLVAAAFALPALAPGLIGLSAAAIGLLPPQLDLIAPLLVSTASLAIPVLVGLLLSVSSRLGSIGPDHIIGDLIAEILNDAPDLGFPTITSRNGSWPVAEPCSA